MNAVERLAILHSDGPVGRDEVAQVLPSEARRRDRTPGYDDADSRTLRERLDDYERRLIAGALQAAQGNVAEAGRRLQTGRPLSANEAPRTPGRRRRQQGRRRW